MITTLILAKIINLPAEYTVYIGTILFILLVLNIVLLASKRWKASKEYNRGFEDGYKQCLEDEKAKLTSEEQKDLNEIKQYFENN